MRHTIIVTGIFVLATAVCGLAILVLSPSLRVGLKNLIARELVHVDFPIEEKAEAIYVLGTGYQGTRRHLKSAAELYNRGITPKIYYFDEAGAKMCDPSLSRTLPRDEWVVQQLRKRGVPSAVTEPVCVNQKFFGTYSEAEAVSNLIVQRKLGGILLITSPYHTKRVRLCFEHFLEGKGVSIRVSGSTDRGHLRDHVFEYLKLKVYEVFLL